jgi:hypothetical protein
MSARHITLRKQGQLLRKRRRDEVAFFDAC